ncbi:MAG: hypothetical protein KF799_09435 [Bdellovibrionales bacterium]|nr:hypothetical protein [Bdellovibrionales bacterium]
MKIFVFCFIFSIVHIALAESVPFGYSSQAPIQIEDHAWLVKRPVYLVGQKNYWVGSYTITENYEPTDLGKIDSLICKRLGFSKSRHNSRREIQPGTLGEPFNFIAVDGKGSVLKFTDASTSVYGFITFWDELICER